MNRTLMISVLALAVQMAPPAHADQTAACSFPGAKGKALITPDEQEWNSALDAAFDQHYAKAHKANEDSIFSYVGSEGTPSSEVGDSYAYDTDLEASGRCPQPLKVFKPNQLYIGGATVFRNDVFPDEFFKRQGFEKLREADPGFQIPWTRLIETQPWLEWDEGQRKMIVHERGAELRIATHLARVNGPKLRLYRGTTPFESEIFETLKLLNDRGSRLETFQQRLASLKASLKSLRHPAEAIATWIKEISARSKSLNLESERPKLREQLLSLFTGFVANESYQSLFVTPEKLDADGFSKGKIVTFEVPTASLVELVQSRGVYLGFETKIETAFFSEKSVAVLADGYVASEDAEVSKIWPAKKRKRRP